MAASVDVRVGDRQGPGDRSGLTSGADDHPQPVDPQPVDPHPVDADATRDEEAASLCRAVEGTDRITLVGLVLETSAGLRRTLTPGLADDIGVGGQSFEILVRLARSTGGRLRMSDLAAQTGLTPSGLTRAVDRLLEAELVTREACPSDRRGAFAVLSALGRTRMDEALRHHEQEVADVLEGVLDPDEEAMLVALLRKLRDRVHPEAALVSDSG